MKKQAPINKNVQDLTIWDFLKVLAFKSRLKGGYKKRFFRFGLKGISFFILIQVIYMFLRFFFKAL